MYIIFYNLLSLLFFFSSWLLLTVNFVLMPIYVFHLSEISLFLVLLAAFMPKIVETFSKVSGFCRKYWSWYLCAVDAYIILLESYMVILYYLFLFGCLLFVLHLILLPLRFFILNNMEISFAINSQLTLMNLMLKILTTFLIFKFVSLFLDKNKIHMKI